MCVINSEMPTPLVTSGALPYPLSLFLDVTPHYFRSQSLSCRRLLSCSRQNTTLFARPIDRASYLSREINLLPLIHAIWRNIKCHIHDLQEMRYTVETMWERISERCVEYNAQINVIVLKIKRDLGKHKSL